VVVVLAQGDGMMLMAAKPVQATIMVFYQIKYARAHSLQRGIACWDFIADR